MGCSYHIQSEVFTNITQYMQVLEHTQYIYIYIYYIPEYADGNKISGVNTVTYRQAIRKQVYNNMEIDDDEIPVTNKRMMIR